MSIWWQIFSIDQRIELDEREKNLQFEHRIVVLFLFSLWATVLALDGRMGPFWSFILIVLGAPALAVSIGAVIGLIVAVFRLQRADIDMTVHEYRRLFDV